MNTDQIAGLLRELPPVGQTSSRELFDAVAARVARHRRRRAQLAVAAAAALSVAAISVVASTTDLVRTGQPDLGEGPTSSSAPLRHGRPVAGSPIPGIGPDLGHVVEPIPGQVTVTDLSDPRTITGAGAETVELGRRPHGATAVETELACLSPGVVVWPDGARLRCSKADLGRPLDERLSTYTLPLAAGQSSLRIWAAASVRWHLRTVYVSTHGTPWGVNAHGKTYGVPNQTGQPDLIAVVADNGRQGYAFRRQLDRLLSGADPAHASVPVYESDGTTSIGVYTASSPSSSASQGQPAESVPPISGTWRVHALVGADGKDLLAGVSRPMTISFSGGKASGSTGCNSYAVPYVQAGAQGADLTFDMAHYSTTFVYCRGDSDFFAMLGSVRHVSRSGGHLYLHADNWMIRADLRPR